MREQTMARDINFKFKMVRGTRTKAGRFYTHELEEYSRYKNKGIVDSVNDEDFYYNAHAASLEAYGIDEIRSPLYHPE
jgi:hypothetical protein